LLLDLEYLFLRLQTLELGAVLVFGQDLQALNLFSL